MNGRDGKGRFVKTHNLTNTRFYRIWSTMKSRCNNKNDQAYKYYGDKGIKVCKSWYKFENFLEDMYFTYNWHVYFYGDKDTTIDRIDNNGNYEPMNCRWATRSEQNLNYSKNRLITYNDKTQTLTEWAEEVKKDRKVLWLRLNKLNWSVEKTLTTPINHIKK